MRNINRIDTFGEKILPFWRPDQTFFDFVRKVFMTEHRDLWYVEETEMISLFENTYEKVTCPVTDEHEEFWNKFSEYWKIVPDWRFTQLMINLCGHALDMEGNLICPDEEMLKGLDKMFTPADVDLEIQKTVDEFLESEDTKSKDELLKEVLELMKTKKKNNNSERTEKNEQ